MPHLEINEVDLLLQNIVSSDYQQDTRVLYTFASNTNKSFSQLLDISPRKKVIFFKNFCSNISYIGVWFRDTSRGRK